MRLPRLSVRTCMLLVGVAALLVWGAMMGRLSFLHDQRARTYSSQERSWREMARRALRQGDTRSIEATTGLQTADYYGRLARKYRRSAWRPWAGVDQEAPIFFPNGV